MKYPSILFLCALLLGAYSCKKGCTNPRAYNYNASAKEEDASCQFCDSSVLDEFNDNFGITDYNSGQHSYQTVLTINLQGNLMRYSGNACKRNGISTDCNGFFDAFTRIRPVLRNVTNDTMLVSGTFFITVSGGNSSEQVFINYVTIPPQGSYQTNTDILFSCVQTTSAQSSVNSQSFNFEYR